MFADSLAKALTDQGVELERADSAAAATTADVLLPDLIVLAGDAALGGGGAALARLQANERKTPTLVIAARNPGGALPHVAYIGQDGAIPDCARRVRALLAALSEPGAGASLQQLADRTGKTNARAGGPEQKTVKPPTLSLKPSRGPSAETVDLKPTIRPVKSAASELIATVRPKSSLMPDAAGSPPVEARTNDGRTTKPNPIDPSVAVPPPSAAAPPAPSTLGRNPQPSAAQPAGAADAAAPATQPRMKIQNSASAAAQARASTQADSPAPGTSRAPADAHMPATQPAKPGKTTAQAHTSPAASKTAPATTAPRATSHTSPTQATTPPLSAAAPRTQQATASAAPARVNTAASATPPATAAPAGPHPQASAARPPTTPGATAPRAQQTGAVAGAARAAGSGAHDAPSMRAATVGGSLAAPAGGRQRTIQTAAVPEAPQPPSANDQAPAVDRAARAPAGVASPPTASPRTEPRAQRAAKRTMPGLPASKLAAASAQPQEAPASAAAALDPEPIRASELEILALSDAPPAQIGTTASRGGHARPSPPAITPAQAEAAQKPTTPQRLPPTLPAREQPSPAHEPVSQFRESELELVLSEPPPSTSSLAAHQPPLTAAAPVQQKPAPAPTRPGAQQPQPTAAAPRAATDGLTVGASRSHTATPSPEPAASDPTAGLPLAAAASTESAARPRAGQTQSQALETSARALAQRQPAISIKTTGAIAPVHPQPSDATPLITGAVTQPSRAPRDPFAPATTDSAAQQPQHAVRATGAIAAHLAVSVAPGHPTHAAGSGTSGPGLVGPAATPSRAPRDPFAPAAQQPQRATGALAAQQPQASMRATGAIASGRLSGLPVDPAVNAGMLSRAPRDPLARAPQQPQTSTRAPRTASGAPRDPFEPAQPSYTPPATPSALPSGAPRDPLAPASAAPHPPLEHGSRAGRPTGRSQPSAAASRKQTANALRTRPRPIEPGNALSPTAAVSSSDALPAPELAPAQSNQPKPRRMGYIWVMGAAATIGCTALWLYHTYDRTAVTATMPGNPATGSLAQTPALTSPREPSPQAPVMPPSAAEEPSAAASTPSEPSERAAAASSEARASNGRRPIAADEPDPTTRTGRARALVESGSTMMKEGRLGLAEGMYMKALQEVPEYPAAMAELVRVHLARRDGIEALRWAQRLVDKQDSAVNQLLLGDALALRGNSDAAQAAWTKAANGGNATARKRLETEADEE